MIKRPSPDTGSENVVPDITAVEPGAKVVSPRMMFAKLVVWNEIPGALVAAGFAGWVVGVAMTPFGNVMGEPGDAVGKA